MTPDPRDSRVITEDEKKEVARFFRENSEATTFKMNSTHMSPKNKYRNKPCFCGSGKKYKKCHWFTESKRK